MSSFRLLPLAALSFALAGCASDYSPNTYASNAVQLANKVETGSVVGFREVMISASGNVGTVTGGAAGGLLGSEYGNSALAAVGGTAVGALVGQALDHATGDTTGWEYIVRKANGDMLSVTQREKKPLALGQRVLVIVGNQARVIADYSTPPEPAPVQKAEAKPDAKPEPKESPRESNVKVEVVLSLPPGLSAQTASGQVIPNQTVTVPVAAAGEEAPQRSAAVEVSGIQATTLKTNAGQTVVVHVPVTGSLVPVSVTTENRAEGTETGGQGQETSGAVTSEPEVAKSAAPETPVAAAATP